MGKPINLQAFTLFNILIWLGGLAVFTFIIYKASHMQVTCDEAYTLQVLPKQTVWELVSYKDSYTNNHILNTLLIKSLYVFSGINLFVGRLPNILSFLVYFYFVYRFAQNFIKTPWTQVAFVAVMVGNVYLIDFFALARGYGLSIGLMMASIYYAADYILKENFRSLPLSCALAVLSVYAQFASLHYFLGLNLLLFLFNLKTYLSDKNGGILLKSLGVLVIFTCILAILIYLPIKAILKDNQIAYYGTKGFWEDTVVSNIKNALNGEGYFSENTLIVFTYLMGVALVFSLILAVQRLLLNRQVDTPSVFNLSILICVAASIILQFKLLGNQYPIDRTGLFVYPLLALNIPSVIAFLNKIKPILGKLLAVILIIFCFYHFIRASRLNSYREWWYDTHTYEVLNHIKNIYDSEKRTTPLSIQTSAWMNPSFSFHQQADKLDFIKPLEFMGKPDTVSDYDYYYIFSDDYPVLKNKYDIIKEYDWKGMYLLKRKQ